jgi:large subunit ribosomal protein L2
MKKGGRNNTGRITIRHRGGGHKRAYRTMNYKIISENGKIHNHFFSGTIDNIFYDPNRSAYLAQCRTDDNLRVFNKILGGTLQTVTQQGITYQGPGTFKGMVQPVSKIKDISVGDVVYNPDNLVELPVLLVKF